VPGSLGRTLKGLGLAGWPAVLVGVVAVSGCFGGESAKPKPPPAVSLVSVSCNKELDGLNVKADEAFDPILAQEKEVEARRDELSPSIGPLRLAVRRLKAAERELRAFNSEHPERYLPQALYNEWAGLRDAYETAYHRYRARLAHARPYERRLQKEIKEANALWKDESNLVEDYEAKLDGCLGPRPALARAERGRITRLEALLSDISGEVAGRQVTLHCEKAAEWRLAESQTKVEGHLLGYVFEGGRAVHLAPSLCYVLHRLRYLHWQPDMSCLSRAKDVDQPVCPPRPSELIRSAVTLAHEAYHVAGEENEQRAQCFGLQKTSQVAQRLGVLPTVADQMAWYAWQFSEAPKSYASPQCKEGGELDIDKQSSVFP
jgi:hypothetical protein